MKFTAIVIIGILVALLLDKINEKLNLNLLTKIENYKAKKYYTVSFIILFIICFYLRDCFFKILAISENDIIGIIITGFLTGNAILFWPTKTSEKGC